MSNAAPTPMPPDGYALCFCHGKPLAQCPMFAPLLSEAQEQQETKAGSRPADQFVDTTELIPPSAATKETTMPPKKAPKTQPVHRHQEEREVRVALQDPEERERILQDMLSNMKNEHELTLEAKEVAVGYRKRLKDLAKQIEGQSLDLKQGLPTMRLVEITRNFSKNELTIKDVESGTVYEKRPMNDDDAQLPISDLPNGDEADDDPKD